MQTTLEPGRVRRSVEALQRKDELINVMSTGYGMLALSAAFYAACVYYDVPTSDNEFLLFVIHYLFAIGYAVVLMFNKAYGISRSWKREHIHKTIILLNLFLVSAYALNRLVNVFHTSTTWLCVYLVVTSGIALTYRFYERIPGWAQAILQVVVGSSLIFYLYLTLYVAPFYAVGGFGTIVLGVGAHIFIPVILLIGLVSLIRHTYVHHDKSYYWIVIGAGLTIGYAALFTVEWTKRINRISTIYNQSVIHPDAELPTWLAVAQSIKTDWITLRILKSDLVYTTHQGSDWDFLPQGISWEETRKHDPLVYISSLFKKTSLTPEDRENILKAIYGYRHEAEDRLWRGNDLSTSYVVSDVDIYPDLRLAYTEKYLTIRNNKNRHWRNTQEAIYTFQLPEGSVVTSLSLWINGKEEKGILTSKHQATTAYNTIVGVERRDPSVIHWQEGNQITVRVFPCTPDEERKVKIGITSPLIEQDGKLKLKNIAFAGPDYHDAQETYRLRFIGTNGDIELPSGFKKDAKGNYVSEQDYDPDFEIAFNTTPLKENQFTFEDYIYSIKPASVNMQDSHISDIYLDINKTWTTAELDTFQSLLLRKNVLVYIDHEFVKLNNDNFKPLTDELILHNYSLFPFHHLKDIEGALVVTKGSSAMPHLSDLNGTPYTARLTNFFKAGKKVKVYDLNGSVPAYISSLREMRGLEYADGSADNLMALLKSQKFPVTTESDESVTLHDARLEITKTKRSQSTKPDNAPDHLARLFAYNNIMRKVGSHYYEKDYVREDLVREAATAYVVSPVSSLIVLESKEDYERFNIKDSGNSLHNASKQSSGAVPEPHEWALIVLFGLIAVYLKLKR